jgi:hypothetical protein
MGTKKTEQATIIPPQSELEGNLLGLLGQIAQGGLGQLGDLGALARGELAGPTGADIELIGQTIGRTRELAESQLQRTGDVQRARLGEFLSSRGQAQGTSEAVQQGLLGADLQNQINQSVIQSQLQGGQALLNLPFQRAQTQIGANQALFQRIIGAAQPALASSLQERLAQPTTTQTTSGFSLGDLMQLGGLAGGLGGLGGLFGDLFGGAGGGAAAGGTFNPTNIPGLQNPQGLQFPPLGQ